MNRLKNYYKRVDDIARKNNRSTVLMCIDILIWYIFYGATLTDYLDYKFYSRKYRERKQYAVVRTQNKFYEFVSPSKYKQFFTVKPNFLNNFKEYVKREWYTPNEGINKLKQFINNHKEFMLKPIDGLGGHGVVKLKSKDIQNVEEFYQELLSENLFMEELIIQHEKMSMLCKSSVNTLRIMTYVNNNKSKILYCALRVGNGEHEVDNFHKGGMGIAIDLKTGVLKGNAIDKNLNEYKRHPKTKILFDKYKLPYWTEVKELVEKAALINQNIKVVGWDVAITKDGPVLVEGNRRPGFDIVQVLSNKGRKDIMYEVLDDIKKTTGNKIRI